MIIARPSLLIAYHSIPNFCQVCIMNSIGISGHVKFLDASSGPSSPTGKSLDKNRSYPRACPRDRLHLFHILGRLNGICPPGIKPLCSQMKCGRNSGEETRKDRRRNLHYRTRRTHTSRPDEGRAPLPPISWQFPDSKPGKVWPLVASAYHILDIFYN
jgi:hypothetical protein